MDCALRIAKSARISAIQRGKHIDEFLDGDFQLPWSMGGKPDDGNPPWEWAHW